ncbi:MAG: PAS domain S-box protein [Deltaproteobacteria bacterium]|nr:PAS domain S-box protein [Deltaproteobacteria bacterium]
MATPLRVLLVEDSDDDAFLLMRELRRGDYEPVITRVADAAEMRAALAGPPFDVILADYHMPRFDGQGALELALEMAPDTPLIVISATIGEETAVAMVKAGAQDYVMKGKLHLLVPAIERARSECEKRLDRQRAEQALRESEEKFRSLIENALDVITVADLHSNVVYESPSVERVFGYQPEELIGTAGFDRIHPDDLRRVQEMWAEVVAHPGETQRVECRERHKDGSWRTIEALGRLIAGPRDQPLFVVNARDITERRQAEQALRESEQRLRSITDNMLDMISATDVEGRFTYISPSTTKVLGYAPEELIGHDYLEQVHPEEQARVLEASMQAIAAKAHGKLEYRFRHADGRYLWLESVGKVMVSASGDAVGAVFGSRDVTDRHQAEQALREREEFYRSLIVNTLDLIAEFRLDGSMAYLSPSVERVLGYQPEDLLDGEKAFQVIHADDREHIISDFMLSPPHEAGGRRYELRLQHRDGGWRWIEALVRLVPQSDRDPRIVVNARDITERKQTEQTVRQTREYLEQIIDAISLPVFVKDRRHRFVLVNDALVEFTGVSRERWIGASDADFFPPEQVAVYREKDLQVLATGQPSSNEEEITVADGRVLMIATTKSRLIDAGGEPFIVGVFYDVSAQRQVEQAARSNATAST